MLIAASIEPATKDIELNGEVIPAETVQKTYIASLAGVFAEIV